jgi:signal transduction histidine kinase
MTTVPHLPGSIRRQFSMVFAVTMGLCAAAAGAMLYELWVTQQASADFIHLGADRLHLAQRLEANLYRAESAEDAFLNRALTADLEQFRTLMAEMRTDAQKLSGTLADEELKAQVSQQLSHIGEYAQLVEKEAEVTLGKSAIDNPAVFRALLVKRSETLGAAKDDTQRTLGLLLAAGPVYANRVEQSFWRLGVWMLVLLLAVAAGAFATFTVGNRIVHQVVSMADEIGELSRTDDLERRLPVDSNDELGTLALTFNSLLMAQQGFHREREASARRDKERAEAIETAYRELSQTTEALRKSQQKLIEADKLATIGQLSAGVAHEVNNPATSVIGNLEYLRVEIGTVIDDMAKRGGAAAESAENIRGALNDSLEGLSRISAIVRDLGAFSRRKDEVELLDIAEPIDVALKMANFEVKYRAKVVRDYQKVPRVTANRGRLQQVFLNLIINAAHAIPKGEIARHSIRVATRAADGVVEVKVSDSGSGIAPEHLQRIFDPFFTTKPSGHGTGLGLAITLDIVHQLGGEIAVDSEIGRGTTFTLKFPATKESAA